jgi:hypothetical protein
MGKLGRDEVGVDGGIVGIFQGDTSLFERFFISLFIG